MSKSKLVCPECGEAAEKGAPAGGHKRAGWSLNVEARRLKHRHSVDGEALCPVSTGNGYQPALPERV